MKTGTLVTVFAQYPGVVLKGPHQAGRLTVMYQMPGGVKVRASISIDDLKEREHESNVQKTT